MTQDDEVGEADTRVRGADARRSTMADIAAQAGVSVSTVSKVLHGRSDVSAKTRGTIQRLLGQHGYTPPGRSARLGGQFEIVINELDNPWAGELIRGAEDALQAEGMGLVVSAVHGRSNLARRWLDGLEARGSLGAIHEYKSRGNRLSQQIALRMAGPKQKPGDTYRDPDEAAVYSVMAADSLETTIATTTLGEIVARGRLLDQNGNRLAGFTQRYRLWRGSRVLHVEVELDPGEEPKADPWNSYYCVRLAWADELADFNRRRAPYLLY